MFHKENERALSLFYYFVKQELNQQPSKKTILKVRYSSFIYKASQEQPSHHILQKPSESSSKEESAFVYQLSRVSEEVQDLSRRQVNQGEILKEEPRSKQAHRWHQWRAGHCRGASLSGKSAGLGTIMLYVGRLGDTCSLDAHDCSVGVKVRLSQGKEGKCPPTPSTTG